MRHPLGLNADAVAHAAAPRSSVAAKQWSLALDGFKAA